MTGAWKHTFWFVMWSLLSVTRFVGAQGQQPNCGSALYESDLFTITAPLVRLAGQCRYELTYELRFSAWVCNPSFDPPNDWAFHIFAPDFWEEEENHSLKGFTDVTQTQKLVSDDTSDGRCLGDLSFMGGLGPSTQRSQTWDECTFEHGPGTQGGGSFTCRAEIFSETANEGDDRFLVITGQFEGIRGETIEGSFHYPPLHPQFVDNIGAFDSSIVLRMADVPTYVALGDSYSSGEGAPPYKAGTDTESNECHRSEVAWNSVSPGGDAIAALPGFLMHHRSAACSGAETPHLQGPNKKNGEASQFKHPALPKADMVTLTIGGNDAYFEKIITLCLFETDCRSVFLEQTVLTLERVVELSITNLRNGKLKNLYKELKEKAPDAAIFVAGYPRVVDNKCPTSPVGYGLENDEITWINEIHEKLESAMKCSADEAGVHFASVWKSFKGHEACGKRGQDWINDIESGLLSWPPSLASRESFHPNRRGQRVYALAVRKKIGNAPSTRVEENPQPKPNQCGASARPQSAQSTSPSPTMDDLAVVPSAPAACANLPTAAVQGENVSLMGDGFAAGASVDLEIRFDNQTGIELGTTTADSDGLLDTTVTVPASGPNSGTILFLARGLGANGGGRLLLGNGWLTASSSADTDGDTVPDTCDSCPLDADEAQVDSDGDGVGDACDICPNDYENDADGDGVCDDVDLCVDIPNLALESYIATSYRIESACQTLTSTTYEVSATGDVTFIAGESIAIGNGFTVLVGGRFVAVNGTP